MKKVLVFGCACIMAAQAYSFAFAGGMDKGCCGDKDKGACCEKMQTKRVDHLSKKLGLSAEQKTKLADIINTDATAMRAEMEKNREAMKAEMDKRREEMKTRQAAMDEKIKAILTPEQATKYDTMMQERREKMEKKMEKNMKKMKHHHDGCEECEGK